jgi:hypothetical protein
VAGIFDGTDVERRGANVGGFGASTSTLQMKPPTIKRDTKRWTKEETKKEEEDTKAALGRMYLEDKFVEHDPSLLSEADLM